MKRFTQPLVQAMSDFSKFSSSGDRQDSTVERPVASHRSHLITRLLTPALKVWLRSQVESVTALEIQVDGGDRQILSGYLPSVSLTAMKAVYQGLHLTALQMQATNIQVNLRQILRSQSLKLLDIVPVSADLMLSESDLNASLQAPILQDALVDLLRVLLLPAGTEQPLDIQHLEIAMERDRLVLTLQTEQGETVIATGLSVVDGHILRLTDSQWRSPVDPIPDWMNVDIDLGQDVAIEGLVIEPERLRCQGTINVIP